MEYISSDTNVWLDFAAISQIKLPFLLPCIYLMSTDAVEDELLSPPDLGEILLSLGLVKTDLTEREFYFAEELIGRYQKLSLYDCTALAIAKERDIVLLTGDRALRKAAAAEGVEVLGTIGILDRLYKNGYISAESYVESLRRFQKLNGGKVRLPEKELQRRIDEVVQSRMI